MHGLINHSIEVFVCNAFGLERWQDVTRTAGLGVMQFESMMTYDEGDTQKILEAMSVVLQRSRADLLEDFGAFLVSHSAFEAVRRLLRFGGEDFVDFLYSLDDLADSVRLAVSNLRLPKVELEIVSDNQFNLHCDAEIEGYGFVMMGVLRVMADDYGALAILDHQGCSEAVETVAITLFESDFAEGRSFDLAANFG